MNAALALSVRGLRTQPQNAATCEIMDRGRGSRGVFLVRLHDVCLMFSHISGAGLQFLQHAPLPPKQPPTFCKLRSLPQTSAILDTKCSALTVPTWCALHTVYPRGALALPSLAGQDARPASENMTPAKTCTGVAPPVVVNKSRSSACGAVPPLGAPSCTRAALQAPGRNHRRS